MKLSLEGDRCRLDLFADGSPLLYALARTQPWALTWAYNVGLPSYDRFTELLQAVDAAFVIQTAERRQGAHHADFDEDEVGACFALAADRVSPVMKLDVVVQPEYCRAVFWEASTIAARYLMAVRDVHKVFLEIPDSVARAAGSPPPGTFICEGVLSNHYRILGRESDALVFAIFRSDVACPQ